MNNSELCNEENSLSHKIKSQEASKNEISQLKEPKSAKITDFFTNSQKDHSNKSFKDVENQVEYLKQNNQEQEEFLQQKVSENKDLERHLRSIQKELEVTKKKQRDQNHLIKRGLGRVLLQLERRQDLVSFFELISQQREIGFKLKGNNWVDGVRIHQLNNKKTEMSSLIRDLEGRKKTIKKESQ